MITVRGTTPTIIFRLPFQTDTIRKLEIYFGQPELLFTKTEEDCTFDENKVQVTLSQAETLDLNENLMLKIQLRFVFNNGSVGATKVISSEVEEIMKDGEIDVGD